MYGRISDPSDTLPSGYISYGGYISAGASIQATTLPPCSGGQEIEPPLLYCSAPRDLARLVATMFLGAFASATDAVSLTLYPSRSTYGNSAATRVLMG